MDNEKLLSQEMADKLIKKIKDLKFRYKEYIDISIAVLPFVITILLKIILDLSYFNKFDASVNFDSTDLNMLFSLFIVILFVLSIYLGNFSQVFFVVDNYKTKTFKLLVSYKIILAFIVLFAVFVDFIGSNSSIILRILEYGVYLYLILWFVFFLVTTCSMKTFNIFSLGLLIIVIQDILLLGLPILTDRQNISIKFTMVILVFMIVFYVMPILFGVIIKKEIVKKEELYIKILAFTSIVPLFIILYFSAPNLLRNFSFANKDVVREIEIKNLPDELIQNLDKNFTKFSCKNLKGYSCFEKKGDNSYEIKNLRFLATNIQEIDLYCIILPKDENSTLNNLPKENCLKILPKDKNIYIDLNGLKDI